VYILLIIEGVTVNCYTAYEKLYPVPRYQWRNACSTIIDCACLYLQRPFTAHPKSTKIELNNSDGWVELTLVQMSLDEVEALIAGAQL
jgi:hypothetical protein